MGHAIKIFTVRVYRGHMADIGYFQQIQGGIPGQPDLGNADPVRQAALQQSVFAQNQAIKEAAVVAGTYVPPGTGNAPSAPEWASQSGGPANLPIVGWTAQKDVGTPFVTEPDEWTAKDMGRIPDWTSDANSAGGGSYDMTPVRSDGDYNPLNRGPIGEPFFDAPGAQEPNNPNTSSKYSAGTLGGFSEW